MYTVAVIDLFAHLYTALKNDQYFIDELSGFRDAAGRFKVFKAGEAPTDETPFITVEMKPGTQDQRTSWVSPDAIFSVHGADTDWKLLWAIADQIRQIFQSASELPAAGDNPAVNYALLGRAEFDEGKNPVTEHSVVSVALRFGFDS